MAHHYAVPSAWMYTTRRLVVQLGIYRLPITWLLKMHSPTLASFPGSPNIRADKQYESSESRRGASWSILSRERWCLTSRRLEYALHDVKYHRSWHKIDQAPPLLSFFFHEYVGEPLNEASPTPESTVINSNSIHTGSRSIPLAAHPCLGCCSLSAFAVVQLCLQSKRSSLPTTRPSSC